MTKRRLVDAISRLIGYTDVEKEDAKQLVQLLCEDSLENERTIAAQSKAIAELNDLKNFLLQALIDAGAVNDPDASVIESSKTATSIEDLPITLRSDALKDGTIQ